MDWLEISVDAHGDPEGMCAQLMALGAESFVIEDEQDFLNFLENNTQYWDFVDDALAADFRGASRVKFWVSDDADGRAVLSRAEAAGLQPRVKVVRDADWENNWRDHYIPIEAGERLVIVPEWQEYQGSRLPVRLDPGLLFGTGDHPTTKLCLRAVEEMTRPGAAVLDIGCGSGILGIAAAVLGCASVTAVDVDEKAPGIVRANAALNGKEALFTVYTGDVIGDAHLRRKLGTGYDLVLANIVADVIIPLAPHVPPILAEDGVFICSGIIDGREEETMQALRAAGLTVLRHDRMEEWSSFLCGRFAQEQ